MITTETLLDSRYRIDVLIDRGGMANVYRAHDLRLEREVAVKVLREVEHQRRFGVEARTLASLHHPNLVRLLDAGTDNGDAYLVLELLDGATLRQLLDRGPLLPARVARIGVETASALDYIHRRGIVHRDIKPSNLMLDERGSVKVADFGIARLLGGTAITTTHHPIGTMAYIAPEQLDGDTIGPPADIYSLGLVLTECLTGRRVFDGPPAVAGAARLSRDPHIPTDLPEPWAATLRAMTARDPAARPTAAALRESINGRDARVASVPAAVTRAVPAARTEAAPTTVAPTAAAPTNGAPTKVAPTKVATTKVGPTAVQRMRLRRRRPWLGGLLVGTLIAGTLGVALIVYRTGSSGGDSTTRPTPTATPAGRTAVTSPSTAQPSTTVLPPPLPGLPDNPGPGNGDGTKELEGWLKELRKLFLQEE
jgi:eukaryotic-like serine/threonine-protein kinase